MITSIILRIIFIYYTSITEKFTSLDRGNRADRLMAEKSDGVSVRQANKVLRPVTFRIGVFDKKIW